MVYLTQHTQDVSAGCGFSHWISDFGATLMARNERGMHPRIARAINAMRVNIWNMPRTILADTEPAPFAPPTMQSGSSTLRWPVAGAKTAGKRSVHGLQSVFRRYFESGGPAQYLSRDCTTSPGFFSTSWIFRNSDTTGGLSDT